MRFIHLAFLTVTSVTLLACGSSEAEAPVEQIVVREPGQSADTPNAQAAVQSVDIAAAGQEAFELNCGVCHSVEPSEPPGIGPNLHSVAGRAAGSLNQFAYSNAMIGSGIIWTTNEIDVYIANPSAKLPGTSMAGVLVADPEDRRAITGYLASLSE